MAIAQRKASVTRGYKVKPIRTERHEPALVRRVITVLGSGARELRALMTSEIIYATVDTLRVLEYVRGELGWRKHMPVVHELEQFVHEHERMPDNGVWSAERGL